MVTLTKKVYENITELRVHTPELAIHVAGKRKRRKFLTSDGFLNLVAVDHPARRVTKAGNNALAMADRHDFLSRIVSILQSPYVDGVMATQDILEELLILDHVFKENEKLSLLNEKLLILSLNRGGLAGASWEMEDRMTGATPETCKQFFLDGAKLLVRVCNEDEGSLITMMEAANAIRKLSAMKLPAFLEMLPVERTKNGFHVTKSAEKLAMLTGVASALGDSSRYLWLKLPYVENFQIVARSTTLPILLLGGESKGNIQPFLNELRNAMKSCPNVRGAMVGRNVLYPGKQSPFEAAESVGEIVHGGSYGAKK